MNICISDWLQPPTYIITTPTPRRFLHCTNWRSTCLQNIPISMLIYIKYVPFPVLNLTTNTHPPPFNFPNPFPFLSLPHFIFIFQTEFNVPTKRLSRGVRNSVGNLNLYRPLVCTYPEKPNSASCLLSSLCFLSLFEWIFVQPYRKYFPNIFPVHSNWMNLKICVTFNHSFRMRTYIILFHFMTQNGDENKLDLMLFSCLQELLDFVFQIWHNSKIKIWPSETRVE